MYQKVNWSWEKESIATRIWNWIKETYNDIKYCKERIREIEFSTIEVDVVYLDDYELDYETPTNSYGSNYKSVKAKNQKRDITGKFIKGYTE
jgi:antitoxin component HigA of HigAB toxin-antitoxin module